MNYDRTQAFWHFFVDYKFDSSKYNRTTLTRMNRQARLEEVNDLLVKLLERQVMLIKKRRELEINKQPVWINFVLGLIQHSFSFAVANCRILRGIEFLPIQDFKKLETCFN